ncbi:MULTISPECIES: transcription termination/antitermination protein NusG [unclassified Sphingomonas]|uniref:transcription termination/antitermination protein NusG n=1 Tax=Sphingomonas TaxID=13687 RepID=UPI00095936A7|nr:MULTISPECIES: transcription termination/antitermination NusG family protein [unclassified Sphingomonas]MBN8811841.1 hypothetical protein [Sphingomonas sp.]OJY52799.1 MAG: hypothetical protein BGP17_14745 [Sphingomonas sp. 67-41]
MTDTSEAPKDKCWYLAQAKPNALAIAELNLRRQDFETFIPRQVRTRRMRNGFAKELRPLFPGYLFVLAHSTAAAWRSINGTLGIARLVQFGDARPSPIPDALITSLRESCDADGRFEPESPQPGERVRLLTGPFADFIGTVEKVAPGQRIWVLLDLLGRATRISAPVSSTSSLTPHDARAARG